MVTVADVAQSGVLRLEVISMPAPQAAVRWVATNEMQDPRAFLEGGELLLFTGLEMGTWRRSHWREYASRVREAGVSAIALAVGPTHTEVPVALTEACQDLGINLMTVPMETSFVAISQHVAGLLESSDRAAARGAVAMQRRLAQAARRRPDPSHAVAAELAAYVDGSVWLVAPDGQVLRSAGRTSTRHADVLAEIAAELAELVGKGLGASSSWSTGSEHTVLQPVGLHAPVELYLAVRTPGVLTDYQRTAVLTSLSMLTLELEGRAEARNTDRMLRRRALDLLVGGEVRAADLVLRATRGRAAGEASLPRIVVAIRGAGAPDRLLQSLASTEDRFASGVVVAALDASGRELEVLATPKRCEAVAAALADNGLSVGIGSEVAVAQAARSMGAAAQALGRTTTMTRTIWWRDLAEQGAISLIDPAARELLADELVAALERSSVEVSDLLSVATAFLRHHGRMNVVADELGMHRNTARARVVEIERVLGCDLDDPSARVDLWVSLQTLSARQW